jgi:hypothetical protein
METVLEEPIAIEVDDEGRVFLIERGGTLSVVTEEETATALELDVYTDDGDGDQPQEDGLVGLALDPDFAENGWVYLYYSPPQAAIDEPHNRLSRFTFADGSVDPETEVEILRVPTQRETCCHTGGEIHFDPDGNLLLTTGDDTNPFESQGYAPIDERDGRENFDAQRTAANTADLRGKALRITPQEDGSYTVPEDNLFTEAQGYGEELEAGLVREEIYVMGLRNPYTAAVDPETGWYYVADYGPDAPEWSAQRGPPGIVEGKRERGVGGEVQDVCHVPGQPARVLARDPRAGHRPHHGEEGQSEDEDQQGPHQHRDLLRRVHGRDEHHAAHTCPGQQQGLHVRRAHREEAEVVHETIPGKLRRILVVYSTMLRSIQERLRKKTTATAKSLGTKERVCSCTCVIAWITLTRTPTTMAAISSGEAMITACMSASRARSSASPCVIESSASEALHRAHNDQRRAVVDRQLEPLAHAGQIRLGDVHTQYCADNRISIHPVDSSRGPSPAKRWVVGSPSGAWARRRPIRTPL